MVVHRQNFLIDSAFLEIERAVDNQVHRLAAFFVIQIVCNHRGTAPAVNQVIEAHAVNILAFEQVENRVQVLHVIARNRKAESHLLAGRHAVADTPERHLEGSRLTAELVVSLFATIQADAHIANAHRLELLSHIRRDAGAVRRNRRADALACRIVCEFKKVRAQKRFATAEQNHRHMKIRKLINKLDSLFVRKFVLVLDSL